MKKLTVCLERFDSLEKVDSLESIYSHESVDSIETVDCSRCKVRYQIGLGSLLPCLAWGSLPPPTGGGWGSLLPCLGRKLDGGA